MNDQSNGAFQHSIRSELNDFVNANQLLFNEKNVLRMDLHCHDHNSNVPDEILGRILDVPETWLPTKKLVRALVGNGMDAITITNHNNGRSCFDLLDKGQEVLVGAEFSCMVPDFQTGIHVLTFGFDPLQEVRLNRLRKNLYAFLEYTQANDLPTIWAHPLYHYKTSESPPMRFFQKMALVFERFEVLNGQRDSWQNMLVRRWVESLTQERIEQYSADLDLDPGRFCISPFRKSMSGGSDSHMGIFAGLTGVRLFVPDLEERKKTASIPELALESVRHGRMAAFGGHNNSEKMMVTLLDYVCQIALHGKDPGLLRILLHKGEVRQKLTAFLVSNAFAELRQHRISMRFTSLFHKSLTGTKPLFVKKWLMPSAYKPIFDEVSDLAQVFQSNPEGMAEACANSIRIVYNRLADIIDQRMSEKINAINKAGKDKALDMNEFVGGLELPSVLRSYIGNGKVNGQAKGNPDKLPDLAGFLDGLSFPLLTSSVILSAHFASARVLYKNRQLLSDFSSALGYTRHPKRMLWLSDSWDDQSGIPMVLSTYLSEIQRYNLPVDILICSETISEQDHLIVTKPQSILTIPHFPHLTIRIPNLLEVHQFFQKGEYDRVICSTEGIMGALALYLKHAYTVPAFFLLNADWKDFAKNVLELNKENRARFTRMIRAFYKSFDTIFVLKASDYNWLTSKKMGINEQIVFQTALWGENSAANAYSSSHGQPPSIPDAILRDFMNRTGLADTSEQSSHKPNPPAVHHRQG